MSEQLQIHLTGSLNRLFIFLFAFLVVGCNPTNKREITEVLILPKNYYEKPYDHPNNFLAEIKLSKNVKASTLDEIFDLIIEVERLSLEKYGQTSPVSLEYDSVKEVLKLDPSLKTKTIDRSNDILIEHITDSIETIRVKGAIKGAD